MPYCKTRHIKKTNCRKLAWKNKNSEKSVYVAASQTEDAGVALVECINPAKMRESSRSLVKSSENELIYNSPTIK